MTNWLFAIHFISDPIMFMKSEAIILSKNTMVEWWLIATEHCSLEPSDWWQLSGNLIWIYFSHSCFTAEYISNQFVCDVLPSIIDGHEQFWTSWECMCGTRVFSCPGLHGLTCYLCAVNNIFCMWDPILQHDYVTEDYSLHNSSFHKYIEWWYIQAYQ